MAKTGRFLHSPSNNTPIVGVGTSYNVANVHEIEMKSFTPFGSQQKFKGFLESLLFACVNITGGATKMTVRICVDTAGNYSAVGDVEVPIDLGITTSTIGTGQIYYDSFPFDDILGLDNIYVFYKVDAGSCDVSVSQLNWSE